MPEKGKLSVAKRSRQHLEDTIIVDQLRLLLVYKSPHPA